MTFTGEVPAAYRGHRIPSEVAKSGVRRRLKVSLLVLVLGLLYAGFHVVRVQTFARAAYLEESIDQRTRVNTVRASRGVIFDRRGNELALSVPTTTVFADPREMTDFAEAARTLAPVLGLTPEAEAELAAKFSEPGREFVYLARELTKERANEILSLGVKGVFSYIEPARTVEGGVAAAVIGATDPDGVGTSGLELQFDDVLTGEDGRVVREVGNNGRPIAGQERVTSAPVPGDDIVLTIDKNIQFHADSALLDRVGQLGAKAGTAIVMDSKTGDIYAISNVRRNAEGAAVLATGNFATVEAHEPGSVSKVFSIAAAIDQGKVTPESVFSVPGAVVIDGFPIRDAWPHPTMDMSLRYILSESSNIGTMLAAQTIAPEMLHSYLTGFGFGNKTGLEYPGESRGILRPSAKWRGTEKSTITYGYGMAATPLQLAAAVNTVANGGVHVSPRLVGGRIDGGGRRVDAPAAETRRVLQPSTAAVMTDMMREVVCTGTGENAKVKGMEIAGKTGTGYKVQDNGTYATDSGGRKYFASFVGFFPARDPKVTILVSIDEPNANSRDRFGSTAAAPVFARLVPTVMHELGIEATGTGTGCKKRPATP
jgi:cell division protein FtsI (penicillin-binding protein 3)